jgi:hypothetical protein
VDDGTACQELTFRAALQSVQPGAVAHLGIEQLLTVSLRAGNPPVIEVKTSAGVLVGALINRVPEMLRCLQRGFEYTAEVLSIDGGDVRVEVRAA